MIMIMIMIIISSPATSPAKKHPTKGKNGSLQKKVLFDYNTCIEMVCHYLEVLILTSSFFKT